MKTTSKSRRGSSYIMVLVATMFILMLAAIALMVTAVSRRTTAHYNYHVGLFDLAVSGNEQALFLINREWEAHRIDIYRQAIIQLAAIEGALYLDQNTINVVAAYRQVLHETMTRVVFDALHGQAEISWNLHATLTADERIVVDDYRANTSIMAGADRLTLRTVVRRYENNIPGTPTTVEAFVEWLETGVYEMVLCAYIADIMAAHIDTLLFEPAAGMTIILDEFTPTMIESMRIAIELSN